MNNWSYKSHEKRQSSHIDGDCTIRDSLYPLKEQ